MMYTHSPPHVFVFFILAMGTRIKPLHTHLHYSCGGSVAYASGWRRETGFCGSSWSHFGALECHLGAFRGLSRAILNDRK